MIVTIILVALFIGICFIPSGAKCPECGSHATSPIKALAIKQTDNKQVILQFDNCFKCHNKFNLIEDGKPVDANGNYLKDKGEDDNGSI